MRISEDELNRIVTDRNKTVKITEAEITHSIRSLLRQFGIFHFKHFGGFLAKKGVSDLLGCYNGKFMALEVKTATGRLSPEQSQFIDDINRNGGIAGVVRSIDDVIKLLDLKKGMLF